ncbi:MAG: hypothetical protein ACOYIB_04025 [Desulfosporosinus sp.]
MKVTNLWLSPEELKLMLQGSLQWSDVASRVTVSKNGIRKLDDTIFAKKAAPKQEVPPEDNPPDNQLMGKGKPYRKLEGQPVIWLLGSVGLLTLSSWFYFVISGK